MLNNATAQCQNCKHKTEVFVNIYETCLCIHTAILFLAAAEAAMLTLSPYKSACGAMPVLLHDFQLII